MFEKNGYLEETLRFCENELEFCPYLFFLDVRNYVFGSIFLKNEYAKISKYNESVFIYFK